MAQIRTSVLSIGRNRGKPRLWIEGRFLERAGFAVGRRVTTVFARNKLVILLDDTGDKQVSLSRKAGRYPILDFNCQAIDQAFARIQHVQVETRSGRIDITPARTERRKLLRKRDGTCGSAFSGGGLLDEAARQAGYRTLFGIEIDPDFADIWQANHTGKMFQGCISQVDMRKLPQVDLLLLGIPCEPFSSIRRQGCNIRRSTDDLPEQHDLADLTLWGLLLVDAVNPTTVIVEQVPQYLQSGIGTVALNVLRRMGYHVETRLVTGTEFGALSTRQRCVIVAGDGPVVWRKPHRIARTLADILLPADSPQCQWFDRRTKSWLFEHWDVQTARGNSFASQQITPATTAVQAITRRYFAGQGGNPVVKDVRPGREGWYRWLTLAEVKRLMGVPEHFDLGPTLTTAGEVLGQGVLVDVFRQIIASVAPVPECESKRNDAVTAGNVRDHNSDDQLRRTIRGCNQDQTAF
jgi:DNA (cytosine-5)-methyltransferase 1